MKKLTNLFKILQISRSQPQYGYVGTGFLKHELSNLAEHHYLATIFAWQLGEHLNKAGAKLNLQKIMEITLVHDLGELFGSDLSAVYAKANPKVRKITRDFENENQKFLSNFFGKSKKKFLELSDEAMDIKSDEGWISKIAEYMEVAHYKFYVGKFTDFDFKFVIKISKMVDNLKDKIAKKEMKKFMKEWVKDLPTKSVLEILDDIGEK